MAARSATSPTFDVVVIGGAIAGASTALLLKRWRPEARILVVERAERFTRKVGEATVEVSALFLSRVLGLTGHLIGEHLPKHGLRYWFSNGPDTPLSEMAEVGLATLAQMPTFQLDREVLDEHVLATAVEAGVELLRPATVREVGLERPENELLLKTASGERRVRARWVVDASGRRAHLAKQLGLWERNEEHPTSALWGRFRGVRDMDGPEVLGTDPRAPRLPRLRCARRQATNHFCTRGSWTWLIPLRGGLTSVGTVYDRRMFELPPGASNRERFETFVRSSSGLRELLADAELVEGDFWSYDHLPYRSRRYMGDGWALVGDAAAFIDPYYSPGLDHTSFTVYATARILEEHLGGELDARALGAAIDRHNEEFERSYDRWFRALYLDKYELMGDAELCGASYLIDTAMYFMGVVGPAYADVEQYRHPLLGQDVRGARLAYRFLSTCNRRLVKLARARQANGTYGRNNERWRALGSDFGLGEKGFNRPLVDGLKLWLGAELDVLGRRLLRPFAGAGRSAARTELPLPEESA